MLRTLNDVKLIELTHKHSNNLGGHLTVVQFDHNLPLDVKRIFFINAGKNIIRGNHAHKECSQFLVCNLGAIEVECFDGSETKIFLLDRPNLGLLIPPSIWAKQHYLLSHNILSVVCDQFFNENDYIRNIDDFIIYRENYIG